MVLFDNKCSVIPIQGSCIEVMQLGNSSGTTRANTTYVGQRAFFTVIHAGDGNLTLGDVIVIVDVVGQQTLFCRRNQSKN